MDCKRQQQYGGGELVEEFLTNDWTDSGKAVPMAMSRTRRWTDTSIKLISLKSACDCLLQDDRDAIRAFV